MSDLREFTHPRLVLCEGPSDVAMMQMLAFAVAPQKHFHIETTAKERRGRGGKGMFKQKLYSLRATTGFDVVRQVLLVADSDEDPAATFIELCECIEAAGFGPAPANPLAASTGNPAVTVLLLPLNGDPGALEDDLRVIAEKGAHWRAISGADRALVEFSAGTWGAARRSKAWLRTFLAGACSRDPGVTLSTALRDGHGEGLLPLNDDHFQPIRDLLTQMP